MKKTLLATTVASLLTHASISVAQEAAETETLVVTANRFEQPVDSVLASVSVLTREDIEALQAQSIFDVIKTLPGVEYYTQGTKANTAGIYIRGTSTRHALVIVDDVRINSVTSGGAAIGLIPTFAIEKIEVIRGPRAAVYGSDAIGGVIKITTIPASGSVHQAKAGFGTNNFSEAGWRSAGEISEKTSGNFLINGEKSDGFKVNESAGDNDVHGYDSKTFIGSLNHKFNDAWNATFTGYSQESLSEYDSSGTKKESEKNEYALAGVLNFNEDDFSSSLQFDLSSNKGADGNADNNATGRSVLETKRKSAAWVNTYTGIENTILNAGVDYSQEQANRGGTNSSDYEETEKSNLAFFVTGFKQIDSLSLEASLRQDKDSVFGTHTTWNLAGGYAINEELEVLASYGSAFKAPTFNDLYWPGAGNDKLKPETSKSSEIGVRGYHEALSWTLTAYHSEIKDMIAWAPQPSGAWVPSNVDNAKIKGLELELNFSTGPISHRLVGDWKDPKNTKDDSQLIRRAKENYKWVATYRYERLNTSLAANHVGKRYDSGDAKLDAYTTADLGMTFNISEDLAAGLRVDNLFDSKYETAKGYPAPERAFYINASYKF
ncbi:outer membrane vitamin B12 receptor BtuB [Vibrio nigripulchritudo ATCC 27043]|uniref:TonB-dependent receptor domain-containing protein n=1 Tax=Vibrio nigripulchritudo TaxID=28173 RepID=UPI00021C2A3D|nr:TonB-dependent receptor [Vibrio nigripulchritudo]EGU57330.1 outer membrane vitamin B12 receptor BtuB [Vibrio nigripulchritudo ATCC 27043]